MADSIHKLLQTVPNKSLQHTLRTIFGRLISASGTTVDEVQINGTAGMVPVGYNYNVPAAAAFVMFVATRPYRVKAISGRPLVIGTGGACTAAFFKAPSATALGSGTALNTGSFDFVGTTNVNQALTLVTTAGVVDIAAGDSVGFVVSGAATSATGNLSITLVPV